MIDLSIIIPSRVDQFLQQTIDDLLTKAESQIEVIVVLGGYWPEPIIKPDPRVKIIHYGTIHGLEVSMRKSINIGVASSNGKYIMKIDDHCMVDQGYDKKLISDCKDNWVVIPRRYRLDADKWQIIEDGRPPVDYMFLDYPYKSKGDVKDGLHGNEWKKMYHERKDILIDDTMSWQGSCYFMKRTWWDFLGPLDEEIYGSFTHESQEIGNKTWLGGGRLVVNKKTWYAHLHKGKIGKGYGFSTAQYKHFSQQKEMGRLNCIDYWINNKWENRIHDFEWLIEKFWPIPNWPENWKEQIKIDAEFDFSKVGVKNFWLQP